MTEPLTIGDLPMPTAGPNQRENRLAPVLRGDAFPVGYLPVATVDTGRPA